MVQFLAILGGIHLALCCHLLSTEKEITVPKGSGDDQSRLTCFLGLVM